MVYSAESDMLTPSAIQMEGIYDILIELGLDKNPHYFT